MQVSRARVLQVRATALGALRRDLIAVLGTERAKGFLLRYGWCLGKEDAEAVRAEFDLSPLEWLEAGPRLHAEAHMTTVRTQVLKMDRETGEFVMEGVWDGSYEAQEHLRHFGLAEEPVCWTLVGYAGGYATAVFGERIIFREMSCIARGDEVCRFVGLPESQWGLRAPRELPLYTAENLSEEVEAADRRIRRQNDQLQHVIAVHDQLTHVLMRGAGLTGIVEALGRLLGCTAAVEDRHYRLLAAFDSRGDQGANGPAPATMAAIIDRRPDLRRQFYRLHREKRSLFLPAREEDPWGDQIIAPVLLGDEFLGFLTMSAVEGLSVELLQMVAERAAMACGLELLRERTIIDVEQRLRGDFLDHLLAADSDPAFLARWAHHLGLELDEKPHRFFLVQPEQAETSDQGWPPSDQDRLQRCFVEVVESRGMRGFGVPRTGALVGLLSCAGVDPQSLAEELRSRAADERLPVWVGISRPFRGIGEARGAYEECRAVLGAMRDGGFTGRIVQVDTMGALQLLFRFAGKEELGGYAQERLGPLLEYDFTHDSDLLPTLHLFLENAGNYQLTAAQLNISVSGLKYRLQRIRAIGGFDLGDPDVRFDLMVALRVLHLLRHRSFAESRKDG